MSITNVLKVENLVKIYGGKKSTAPVKALNGINLNVHKGEFVGVMGPSGSGKTTLLNILSGIDQPSSGSVTISDININQLAKNEMALFRRRKTGFVFQDFNLLDSLTVKENIMLPMVLDGKELGYMESKVSELASIFDMGGFINKYPYNLSGGEQQRVAISRALVNEPDIVFADEPTGNLDSKSSKAVMGCFEKMNKIKGSTVLVVTHDPVAASYCRRIVFIKDGKVHMELAKRSDRKEFFERILDGLAVMGGDYDEL